MTISEIRDILKQGTVEKTVLEEIMADERKSVRQLVDALQDMMHPLLNLGHRIVSECPGEFLQRILSLRRNA